MAKVGIAEQNEQGEQFFAVQHKESRLPLELQLVPSLVPAELQCFPQHNIAVQIRRCYPDTAWHVHHPIFITCSTKQWPRTTDAVTELQTLSHLGVRETRAFASAYVLELDTGKNIP